MMMEHCGLKRYNTVVVASVICTSYSQIAWLIPAASSVYVCGVTLKLYLRALGTDEGWGERLKDSK